MNVSYSKIKSAQIRRKKVFIDKDLPEEDKQALEDVPEVVVSLDGSEGVHHLGIHISIKLEI